MSQMALPLDWTQARDFSSGFLVSDCNAEAVRHLEHSGTWPVRTSILVGPPRSGKSLLGGLFARATGGAIVDDVADQSDDAMFHAWNRAQETRLPLLLIAETAPEHWAVTLPDLCSRLRAAPVIEISDPDDGLIAPLIARLFLDRGTGIDDGVAAYLAPRIERSYAAIHELVTNLDEAALAEHKRITVPFARQFFAGRDAPGLPGLDAPVDVDGGDLI